MNERKRKKVKSIVEKEKDNLENNGYEDEVEFDDSNDKIFFADDLVKDDELANRIKKIVKIIDILEFIDSCLIVGERFLKEDEEAKEIVRDLRNKIIDAETLFTDYLITGKIPKVQ
jgi:hypothetical protein